MQAGGRADRQRGQREGRRADGWSEGGEGDGCGDRHRMETQTDRQAVLTWQEDTGGHEDRQVDWPTNRPVDRQTGVETDGKYVIESEGWSVLTYRPTARELTDIEKGGWMLLYNVMYSNRPTAVGGHVQ